SYILITVCRSSATASAVIYPLSLHDALPIWRGRGRSRGRLWCPARGPRGNRGFRAAAPRLHAAVRPPRRSWPMRARTRVAPVSRSEEHTSELQSRFDLVCRLLPEKKKSSERL